MRKQLASRWISEALWDCLYALLMDFPNARFSRNCNHRNWNGTSWRMIGSLGIIISFPLAQSVCGISILLTFCHFTVLLHPDYLTWLKQTHLSTCIYVCHMSQCHRSNFWRKLNGVAFLIFYFLLLICNKKTISCMLGLAYHNKSWNGPPYTTLFIQKVATCFSHTCLSSGCHTIFFCFRLVIVLHDLQNGYYLPSAYHVLYYILFYSIFI